ncbi:hypothetical protein C8A03DRAFT_33217 [Achaetomium macrosporum]|uniref:Uncharacterized protein n=1 Tax=Achaetomium macrosporum TaxID=79813 RepID=A0AAN7H7I5_9PEZI|nr:hypothetical protein C8A03DRAFT_33217 [Achaetomium macrosporum]
MDSLPNEVKLTILWLLDDERDRDALVAAYPSWKDAVEYDDSFRTVKVDPAGVHRMPLKDFLERFKDSSIRQRQLLRDVKVGFHLDKNTYVCSLDLHRSFVDRWILTKAVQEVFDTLRQLEDRVRSENNITLVPIRLSFTTCTESIPPCDITNCSFLRMEMEVKNALPLTHNPLTLFLEKQHAPEVPYAAREPSFPWLRGVHDFVFRNQGLLRYLGPLDVMVIARQMRSLRRLRLEFDEDELWSTKSKDGWRSSICYAVASNLYETFPIEEVHIHIGHHSLRDDIDLAALRPKYHGRPPFPALRTFRLHFGPDTTDAKWFFVEEPSERPLPPPLRRRTLPNNRTINPLLRGAAKAVKAMEKIETFSMCLADKFYFEVVKRVFEVHFVKAGGKKPEDDTGSGGRPTLTFKLGEKVDTWWPADNVLAAWRSAAGGNEAGLEILFVE